MHSEHLRNVGRESRGRGYGEPFCRLDAGQKVFTPTTTPIAALRRKIFSHEVTWRSKTGKWSLEGVHVVAVKANWARRIFQLIFTLVSDSNVTRVLCNRVNRSWSPTICLYLKFKRINVPSCFKCTFALGRYWFSYTKFLPSSFSGWNIELLCGWCSNLQIFSISQNLPKWTDCPVECRVLKFRYLFCGHFCFVKRKRHF